MSEEVWKKAALALAQRVNFAIGNLKAPGSGMIGNFDPNADDVEMQHWIHYFADALDLVPGVTVDRELAMVNNLPVSKRKKEYERIKAERANATQQRKEPGA